MVAQGSRRLRDALRLPGSPAPGAGAVCLALSERKTRVVLEDDDASTTLSSKGGCRFAPMSSLSRPGARQRRSQCCACARQPTRGAGNELCPRCLTLPRTPPSTHHVHASFDRCGMCVFARLHMTAPTGKVPTSMGEHFKCVARHGPSATSKIRYLLFNNMFREPPCACRRHS